MRAKIQTYIPTGFFRNTINGRFSSTVIYSDDFSEHFYHANELLIAQLLYETF